MSDTPPRAEARRVPRTEAFANVDTKRARIWHDGSDRALDVTKRRWAESLVPVIILDAREERALREANARLTMALATALAELGHVQPDPRMASLRSVTIDKLAREENHAFVGTARPLTPDEAAQIVATYFARTLAGAAPAATSGATDDRVRTA